MGNHSTVSELRAAKAVGTCHTQKRVKEAVQRYSPEDSQVQRNTTLCKAYQKAVTTGLKDEQETPKMTVLGYFGILVQL